MLPEAPRPCQEVPRPPPDRPKKLQTGPKRTQKGPKRSGPHVGSYEIPMGLNKLAPGPVARPTMPKCPRSKFPWGLFRAHVFRWGPLGPFWVCVFGHIRPCCKPSWLGFDPYSQVEPHLLPRLGLPKGQVSSLEKSKSKCLHQLRMGMCPKHNVGKVLGS